MPGYPPPRRPCPSPSAAAAPPPLLLSHADLDDADTPVEVAQVLLIPCRHTPTTHMMYSVSLCNVPAGLDCVLCATQHALTNRNIPSATAKKSRERSRLSEPPHLPHVPVTALQLDAVPLH